MWSGLSASTQVNIGLFRMYNSLSGRSNKRAASEKAGVGEKSFRAGIFSLVSVLKGKSQESFNLQICSIWPILLTFLELVVYVYSCCVPFVQDVNVLH